MSEPKNRAAHAAVALQCQPTGSKTHARIGRSVGRRTWLLSACVLLLPLPALATPKSRKIVRFERPVKGSSLRIGAARGAVAATSDEVMRVVTDYAGYARFIEQFERARVVKRSANGTDLYLEIPILRGLTKIWAVIRFQPPIRANRTVLVRGRMVKGNVKRLDVDWQVHELEAGWSQLTAELLVDLKIPAPRSSVLKTVKRAAAQAVRGARREAEQRTATRS